VLRHDRVLLSQDTALHLGRSLGPERVVPGDTGGTQVAPSAPASMPSGKGRESKAASRPKSKSSSKAKSPARAKSKSKTKGKDRTKDRTKDKK